MFCRNCGGECSQQAIACTSCGVAPSNGKKFCNSCGESTNENAIMCVKCGCSLVKENNFKMPNVGEINPVFGGSGTGEPNPNPVSSGTAILWYLICYPIGYSQWGQGSKGWISILILIVTGGFAGIVLLVDYIMCYNAQKARKLGGWEFFPKN
tara:strand:+ start:123 stop:581 length:459 start_codon:yes stop_codon:yes gene_type:complete